MSAASAAEAALQSGQKRSLLLFLAMAAIDKCGRFDFGPLNQLDHEAIREWGKCGLVETGRVCSRDCRAGRGRHWVRLSNEAWSAVREIMQERAESHWRPQFRSFQTTEEYRAAFVAHKGNDLDELPNPHQPPPESATLKA